MKTHYSYPFYGDDGLLKMQDVMKMFRFGFKTVAGLKVEAVLVKGAEPAGCGAVEYRLEGGCSVTVIPSEKDPGIEICFSAGESCEYGSGVEKRIREDLESIIYIDHGAAYCCE